MNASTTNPSLHETRARSRNMDIVQWEDAVDASDRAIDLQLEDVDTLSDAYARRSNALLVLGRLDAARHIPT